MNFCRFGLLPILLAALMLNPEQSSADVWQQTGSARISAEYDTNPAMSPTHEEGVLRALFEPSYTVMGRLGLNELKTGLALQVARSSNETLSQNRVDPSMFIDWLHQTDAGEFGILSRYAETSTRIAEIGNTGPEFADSTRVSRTVSGRWRQALSDRSTVLADGSYEGVSYTGGTYIDYVSRTGSLMYRYAYNEQSTPFLRISYADYEPAGGGQTSRLDSATLGLNKKISDSVDSTLEIGKYQIRDGEMGSHGSVTVQYTGQKSMLFLNATRQVLPSGLGGFVIIDQTNFRWSYTLDERSQTGIDLGWQNNHFLADIVNRTVRVWLQYDLNSFWESRLYYLHRITEQSDIGVASSNILGLSFVYTHADF